MESGHRPCLLAPLHQLYSILQRCPGFWSWMDLHRPTSLACPIHKMLSPAIASIALAGLAAAAMSTTDSLLLMAGSCISHDIMRKYVHERKGIVRDEAFYVKASRITILIVGIVTILGALNTPGLILVITSYAVALTGASFAAPMVLGLNWKRTSSSALLLLCSVDFGFGYMGDYEPDGARVHPHGSSHHSRVCRIDNPGCRSHFGLNRIDATLEQFFPEKRSAKG